MEARLASRWLWSWILFGHLLSPVLRAQEYMVARLDPPTNNFANASIAKAINNRGFVVGGGSGTFTTFVACAWAPGQSNPYQQFFVSAATNPGGINDSGDVVWYGPASAGWHGFVNGVDLGPGFATDVNSSRQVVGHRYGGVVGWPQDSSYIYRQGVFDYFPASPWGSTPVSINDSGLVVGSWGQECQSCFVGEAFIFQGDSVVLLGTLGGDGGATDINNLGQIAGWSCLTASCPQVRGFILHEGRWTVIPTLGGTHSLANAINDSGIVVGSSTDAGGTERAIIFDTVQGVRDLNALIPAGSGWSLRVARDINESGQIVGEGRHNGLIRGFVLTPLPRLVLRDAFGDSLPFATVMVTRVRYDPPQYSEDTVGTFTSDFRGEVPVDTAMLRIGDSIKISMLLHTQPAAKHQTVLNTMYSVYLDNMVVGSDSRPVFPPLTGGRQSVYMIHTTIVWNMLISMEWDVRADYWSTLESGLRGMANYMYDVSDGQMRLDTVWIFDNADHWAQADVQIHTSNVEHPRAWIDSVRGSGHPVSMPRKWYGNDAACRNGSFSEQPLNLNDSVNYTTLFHEWGHYALGFYDEYQFPGGSRCGSVPNYGFMDSQYPFPWNGPYRSEMSTATRYAQVACQNNRHWLRRGMSCWDWFKRNFERRYSMDSIFAPIKRPADRNLPPGQDFLSGPNDALTLPDYDVGAQVIFPNPPAPATSSTWPLTLTDRITGATFANVQVQIQQTSPRRILNQGQTSDSGQIQLLGTLATDTLLAVGRAVYGAPSLGASRSALIEAWVSTLIPMEEILNQGLVALIRPLHGDYRMLFKPEYASGDTTLQMITRDSLPAIPWLDHQDESGGSTIPVTPGAFGYQASIRPAAASSGLLTLQGLDDSGYAFFVPCAYAVISTDTTGAFQTVEGEGVSSSLHIDSGNGAVTSVWFVESVFPVLRDGLPIDAVQAGPALGVTWPGASNLTGDNTLVLRYDDGLLHSIEPLLEGSLALFRWNESFHAWEEIGGYADTARDELSGPVSAPGLYAAFTTSTPVGAIEDPNGHRPHAFTLDQNYPNPFNAQTRISYKVPDPAWVRLIVFNLLGQKVATLVNEFKRPGLHSVAWDGTDATGRSVASGIYLYRIEAGQQSATKRMLLLK